MIEIRMTNEEAIRQLNYLENDLPELNYNASAFARMKRCIDIGRDAIVEVQRYRKIGSIDDVENYVRLAEKLNVCDLVSENNRLMNKVKYLEAELMIIQERIQNSIQKKDN